MRNSQCFAVFLILSLLSLPVVAQDPQPQNSDVIIRATTRLVQVGVIVKDKSGQPVTGLTRNDFTIQDGGQDQKIQLFSVETNAVPSGKAAAKLPAGTLTNRPSGYAGVPRNLTVILMDMYNTKLTDHVQAREAILKFLEQLQPTDHVAVYAMGTKLTIVQDFTTDPKVLVDAVKKFRTNLSTVGQEALAEPAAGAGPVAANDLLGNAIVALNQGISDMTDSIANFQTMVRAQQSLQNLEAIAGSLAGIPGRKNLVWVCGDFPLRLNGADIGMDPQLRDLKTDIERAARAVNSANIAIYPVDAQGLFNPGVLTAQAPGDTGSSRNPGVSRAGRPNTGPVDGEGLAERITSRASDKMMLIHSAMNDIADRTGGRAFYNTNNLKSAIRQAVDDSQVTYMLSYAPTHNEWNGKFREVKVKIDKPGLQLMYRKGYIALPDVPTDNQQRKVALVQAAAAPVNSSGIGLKVRPVQQGSTMVLNIEMDLHEISFELKNGKHEALVDLFFVMSDLRGKALDQIHQPADLSLSPEDYKKLEASGIGLSLPLPIAPGTARIRVVARDNSSGQVGSLDVPVNP